jgi:hypothetical protein
MPASSGAAPRSSSEYLQGRVMKFICTALVLGSLLATTSAGGGGELRRFA